MNSELEVFNDPDVILAQTQAGITQDPLLVNAIGGAVTSIAGALGPSVLFSFSSASGFSGSAVGAANTVTFAITVSNAATARSNLGAAAKASPAIVGATIPLAKITGGGVDGSITVNAEGIVTAYVAPT